MSVDGHYLFSMSVVPTAQMDPNSVGTCCQRADIDPDFLLPAEICNAQPVSCDVDDISS
jgi:hypothetical protein